MPDDPQLIDFFNNPGDLRFATSDTALTAIKNSFTELKSKEQEGSTIWYLNDYPSIANTRIKRYPTGHTVFYNPEGLRFSCIDPEGHLLHECEWKPGDNGFPTLVQARMQLDSRQWVGILPEHKPFSTDINIHGQPGWEKIGLDDLRKGAAKVWKVPFEEVKYFYRDEAFQPQGDGKYHIEIKKDSLFALDNGNFDKMLFLSFMFKVNWGKLDLLPVVELFQSTLAGTGGAVFELIWGLYEDQSREEKLSPLRYRGLPTYPSREAFNIFSAFFTPTGPDGEDVIDVFMDTQRSYEITWEPKLNPPFRYFNLDQQICLTVQDRFLYKVNVWDDPAGLPYINCSKGGKPPCLREVKVEDGKLVLFEGEKVREIPLDSKWGVEPVGNKAPDQKDYPITWKDFFGGEPPKVDPKKMLFTNAFYPEGEGHVDESAVQPIALDQIFYYLEEDSTMPERLSKVKRVLVHTWDAVIAGCVDCTHNRNYKILYSDPEFATKNAQLLWNFAAASEDLGNLENVQFLEEAEHVDDAYRQKYEIIFKWIPFMFFQDQENCQAMLQSLVEALEPQGLLFLAGPFQIGGMFDYYGLNRLQQDSIAETPFFRQHLKVCPDNMVHPDATVFMLEKRSDS